MIRRKSLEFKSKNEKIKEPVCYHFFFYIFMQDHINIDIEVAFAENFNYPNYI